MSHDPEGVAAPRDSALRQFARHAWERKAYWMTPLVMVLAFLTLLLLAGHSSAPFRYTLF